MRRGLLSRLAEGERTVDELESVVAHLAVLLNTQVGASPANPTFGLPDFNDVVHQMPEAIRRMQQLIRDCILEHEPRLRSVSVQHVPTNDPLRLGFDIVARLRTDRRMIRLHTEIRPGGRFILPA